MKTITPHGTQLRIDPNNLTEAPWNPRREINQEALDALTASVRDVGILQPLVVREVDGGAMEVVCGHRRLAAARFCGLETVPVIVVQTDEATALEMAMAENLQREDLTEIDEAEAYQAWRERNYTVEEIALKVGRSVTHVYQRLKLLDLPETARGALKDGRLTLPVAVLIGRIPGSAQREKATEKVLAGARTVDWRSDDEGGPVREPMSYQAARKLLVEGYMLTLADAPFDVNDPDLVPAAGSCANCHHRTGNQKDLFGDVVAEGGTDVCTYPACYESKREAHVEAACAGTGLQRLKLAEMDKTFLPGSTNFLWNSKWVDADKPAEYGATGKKPLRKALGEAAPKEFVAIDGSGKVRHLYRTKDVKAALEAMKPAEEDKPAGRRAANNADNERLEEATLDVIRKVIVARGSNPDSINTERLARAVAVMVLARSSHSPDAIYGIDIDGMHTGEILKKLKPIGVETLIVLMAEAVFGVLVEDAVEDCLNDTEVWAEIEKIYGFTLASARKQAQASLEAEDAAATGAAEPEPTPPARAPKPRARSKKKVAKKGAKKVTKKAVKKPAKKARAKK